MVATQSGIKIANWVFNNLKVLKNYPDSKSKGEKGRCFKITNLQSEYTQEFIEKYSFPYKELKHIQENLFNFFKIPPSPYSATGVTLLYAPKGYKPHWSQDINLRDDEYTTHLKVMLNKPVKGGMPMLKKENNEVTLPLNRFEPWLCVGGKEIYSIEKIQGESPYISLSFSYRVKKGILESLRYI